MSDQDFDQYVVDLLRSNRGPMLVDELVHELTILRRTCRADLLRISEEAVRQSLVRLSKAGKAAETPKDVWHWQQVHGKSQGTLFG